MQINIELYEALTAINVPNEQAKRVAESFSLDIEKRMAEKVGRGELSSLADRAELKDLATTHHLDARIAEVRKDVAEMKATFMQWLIGAAISIVGLTVTLMKML